MAVYDTLNPMQKEAVFYTEGPLLILAGAGSGKTRVLTHRVAYLIEEKQVNPWNIMAITFTNKAAGEMRERVDGLVKQGAASVWVSTFHSTCVRILRRFIDRLGYENGFSIYDADDQRILMKQVLKRMDLDPKQFRERSVLAAVSNAKNELISPEEFRLRAEGDYRERKIAEAYQLYQEELRWNNALDFDDLIFKTVDLFRCDPDVLANYQERFRYIMVDEYQDTNTAQFQLISLLAGKYKNLCVVGDDDQSIYKFRGANINNILDFEGTFPGAKVIRLEQNYRSTGHILDVANAVIQNNVGRREKKLWTENGEGYPVVFRHYDHAFAEAEGIVRDILNGGRAYQDYAVLYRTNAQSRLLEEKCVTHNVPYRLVGGINFYARKEIKDILAYLKTIANGRDDMAVRRIINVPKRGIGATSVERVAAWAAEQDLNFYEACKKAETIPEMSKAAGKIRDFVKQIELLRSRLEGEQTAGEETGGSVKALIEAVLDETGYRSDLANEGETEALARLENINELINKAVAFAEIHEETGLAGLNAFLEEVALVADVDSLDESENRVTLMTLHSAKGLEFPIVYLSGMEDGLFPGSMAIFSDNREDLEEERRLCYVGITRAKERLILTASRSRMVNGETRFAKISRFIDEIPEEMLVRERSRPRQEDRTPHERNAADPMMWRQRQKELGVSRFGVRTNSYASPTAAFGAEGSGQKAAIPGFGKPFAVQKSSALSYAAGDRVRHIKFGEGIVQNIQDGPKDFEVTVNFDRVGIKKMFASFAKLEKL